MAYGKSFSNNYLEQKRVNNHNEETYLYKKADFEPIVTEEEFKKAMEIRKRRTLVIDGYTRKNGFGEEKIPIFAASNRVYACHCVN